MRHYVTALIAICHREALRFFGQRARMIAALVRPLMWLFVFAAGFRAALGLSITPPYETYISYETYIVPGLCAMILLFNGMQSSLSLVMDREMGTMRLLLTAPLPRWWLLSCKLVAGAVISVLQAVVFLAICAVYGIRFSPMGYVAALPAMFLCALMVGALGIALSSTIRSLENFAGVMNFVIFPMFFLSTALYPLWKMAEASELLWWICAINPFSHGVETIRFALYLKADPVDWAITVAAVGVFMALALWGYDPGKRTMGRKGQSGLGRRKGDTLVGWDKPARSGSMGAGGFDMKFVVLGVAVAMAGPVWAEDLTQDLAMELGPDTEVTEQGTLNPHEMSMAQVMESIRNGDTGMVICSQGYLVTKSGRHEMARELFKSCADHGWTGAMTWMSQLDDRGLGGPQDLEAAADWNRKAAEAGDPVGKFNHGLDLMRGWGVARDEAAGRAMVDEAARDGLDVAQRLQSAEYDLDEVTPDADEWRYLNLF